MEGDCPCSIPRQEAWVSGERLPGAQVGQMPFSSWAATIGANYMEGADGR